MIIHYTDAGRAVGGFASIERLDCSVRAVAIALGLPYASAHAKLSAFGRQTGGLLYNSPTFFLQHLGLEQRPDLSCRTVATALRDMGPTGRFIVRVYRHVFAVVDGVVHDLPADCPKPTARVRMVYQVI